MTNNTNQPTALDTRVHLSSSTNRPIGWQRKRFRVPDCGSDATLLNYCNNETLRRRILARLNRGESRHALAREVFHGDRGELRQPYHQGQEEQLGAYGLVVNCIALYNTIYTSARSIISTQPGTLSVGIRRAAQPAHARPHHTLSGGYRIALPDPLRDPAAYGPFKAVPSDAAAA
ncbi:MAG: Tn3 family transposase [Solirubrobacteraceae bacterium]